MNITKIMLKGQDEPLDVLHPPIEDPMQIRALIRTKARQHGKEVNQIILINSGPNYPRAQVWYIETRKEKENEQQ